MSSAIDICGSPSRSAFAAKRPIVYQPVGRAYHVCRMMLGPGSRVGVYEVTAVLGAGAMGTVYRARDPRLGRDVALKTLPETARMDDERVGRFRREAMILA